MAAAVYASPVTALERRLQKSWRSISLTTVQKNLIGLMSDRLKSVIGNKGDTVLY